MPRLDDLMGKELIKNHTGSFWNKSIHFVLYIFQDCAKINKREGH